MSFEKDIYDIMVVIQGSFFLKVNLRITYDFAEGV